MKSWLLKALATALVIGGATGYILLDIKGINPNKDFVTFTLNNANAVINQTSGEMDITLPSGTNLTNLAPTFVITGTQAQQNGKTQYSGSSYHNFTSNVPYVVFASDGSTKNYFTHVITSSGESGAYFQYYDINSNTNNGLSHGIITGSNIAITVPSNTNLTSLSSYFNYVGFDVKIGSTSQISNITTNSFSSPITYGVYGKDGTPNNYTVTVTKAATSAKDITYFAISTNNGVYPCQINSLAITCGIPNTIPSNTLIAQWSSTGSIVKIGSAIQTSGLSVNNFSSPVTYNVVSGDGGTNQNYTVTVSNNYTLLEVVNLAKTIFDNIPYNVTFKLTNNTGSTLTTIASSLSVPAPFVWTLTNDGCNGHTVTSTSSCSVTGTLSVPKTYGTAAIKFNVNNNAGQPIAEYSEIVTAVPSLNEVESGLGEESYAAFTILNDGAHRLFATADVNGNNIQFDTKNVGSFSSCTTCYSTYAVELVKGNNTLYIPAFPGVGGKILLSVDNKLPDGPTPSVTSITPSDTYYTRWQQVEYGGGLTGSSMPAFFNLNPTNVDFFALPTSISTVITGDVGVFSTGDYVAQGAIYGSNVLTSSVYAIMESGLANVPNANVPSWGGLTQFAQDGTSVLRILSPSSIFPFMSTPSSQFYFNGAFYTQYITDLWAYYTDNGGGNFLYVDDSPVASLVTPGSTCILKCQVTHTDSLMHCVFSSGVCPVNSSTGTLDGAYSIGGESSPAGFTEFTPEDFVSAAGVNTVTTFGVNGTYRSISGENIVAAQSIGFLPFCSNTSFIFGTSDFLGQLSSYYTPQYTCLTNYSSYTGSVIDQYSLQATLYMPYYNYGYSDTIGQSGAIYNLNNESWPFTVQVHYQ